MKNFSLLLKEDFDASQLKMQLGILSANFSCESAHINLHDVISHLRELSSAQKSLISEVCKLVSLILVMPATNAVSERSLLVIFMRKLKISTDVYIMKLLI